MERLLKPSKNQLQFICFSILSQYVIWFILQAYYIEADSREVWQKYRGEFTREVIYLIT